MPDVFVESTLYQSCLLHCPILTRLPFLSSIAVDPQPSTFSCLLRFVPQLEFEFVAFVSTSCLSALTVFSFISCSPPSVHLQLNVAGISAYVRARVCVSSVRRSGQLSSSKEYKCPYIIFRTSCCTWSVHYICTNTHTHTLPPPISTTVNCQPEFAIAKQFTNCCYCCDVCESLKLNKRRARNLKNFLGLMLDQLMKESSYNTHPLLEG